MVEILRLSHRISRDKRISTHCALVARAFLAKKIYYSGQKDRELEESVNKITKRFGGDFEIKYVKDYMKVLEGKTVVHLTVYGMPVCEKINEIKKEKNVIVVIGGEKVPPEIYEMAKYNVSVTNQPHSEVSSLAIFLHEIFNGKEFGENFKNSKVKIVPQERGKKVIKT